MNTEEGKGNSSAHFTSGYLLAVLIYLLPALAGRGKIWRRRLFVFKASCQRKEMRKKEGVIGGQ